MVYDLIVVGGGAAGFFAAINAAERNPDLRILILEKSNQFLAKVKVSGGGRCNVTHQSLSPASLSHHYPRGQKPLKQLFHRFQATDTVAWFEAHGVKLKTEPDGRMFPTTDRSDTIINLFLKRAEQLDIEMRLGDEVTQINRAGNAFTVQAHTGKFQTRYVLVATGGYHKPESYQWLSQLGHTIVSPIPSLFTFNDPSRQFNTLMGVSVPNATVKIAGTKFSQTGAVLITHWGLSGPAVIKLSAWAAVLLHEKNYTFTALINWTHQTEVEVRKALMQNKAESKKQVLNGSLFELPKRLWDFLCQQTGIQPGMIWPEVSDKQLNRLVELIFACPVSIRGKTTFKEEFVTCGGVSLSEIDLKTMESKKLPGLFFAGEVLDVDGETGGFNFQAAWTTAWVAAESIAK